MNIFITVSGEDDVLTLSKHRNLLKETDLAPLVRAKAGETMTLEIGSPNDVVEMLNHLEDESGIFYHVSSTIYEMANM